MTPREALFCFLRDRFDPRELRHFVDFLPDGAILSASLPAEGERHDVLVGAVIGLLHRHGALDRAFFARLERERPRFKSEIEVLARMWLGPQPNVAVVHDKVDGKLDLLRSRMDVEGIGRALQLVAIGGKRDLAEALPPETLGSGYVFLLVAAAASELPQSWLAQLDAQLAIVVPVGLDSDMSTVAERIVQTLRAEGEAMEPGLVARSAASAGAEALHDASLRTIRMVSARCLDIMTLRLIADELGFEETISDRASVHGQVQRIIEFSRASNLLHLFTTCVVRERPKCVARNLSRLQAEEGWPTMVARQEGAL